MVDARQSLLEIGESLLLSTFEPYALGFRSEYEEDLGRVIAAIRRARPESLARLRWPVNRNSFLIGCCDFTAQKDHEHLIIGHGFRQGNTTKIESIHRIVGSRDRVGIPPGVGQAMLQFYEADPQNKVILFHNHPATSWRLFFDNDPLPSGVSYYPV